MVRVCSSIEHSLFPEIYLEEENCISFPTENQWPSPQAKMFNLQAQPFSVQKDR